MVGSAILRALDGDVLTKSRTELDLTDQSAVRTFFVAEKLDRVVLAAAKVGGIHANNSYPAEFIYENLMIEANVIHQADAAGVNSLLFLGSSCIYPKAVPQPMREDALLTGVLEPTNEPYAIAKIAGIKLCESYNRQYGRDYRSVMPTNLYGPGDNFHPSKCPCPAGTHAPLSRSPKDRPDRGHDLGHRHPDARVSPCGRHGRSLPLCHGSGQTDL